MGERSLGIEVRASRINLVEIEAADPPRVHRFSAIPRLSPEPESIGRQIQAAWPHLGFKSRRARAAVSPASDACIHSFFSLPPMPKSEMRIVIEREMKTVSAFPLEGMVFDAQVIGEEESNKRVILAAAAPGHLVEEEASFLRDLGLEPELVTTVPVALFNALRRVETAREGIAAHIHLGDSKIHILILRQGRWAFHREFPRSSGKEEISAEVHRTFLYFRQKFQGEKIGKFFLTGSGGEGSDQEWPEALGIQLEPFRPALDLGPLKGKAPEFLRLLPEFVIPLGLAGVRAKEAINLFGRQAERVQQGRRLRRAAAGGMAAGALLLAAGDLWLREEIAAAQKGVQVRTEELKRMAPYLAAQKERELYLENSALVRKLSNHPLWTELLKEISLLVPPELSFQAMSFKREGEKTRVSLKGEAFAKKAVIAQEVFNLFYLKLSASPFFSQLEVDPGSMKIHPPAGGEKEGLFRLEFEIKGELKPLDVRYENI